MDNNTYIFLTDGIGNMGGAQMYIRNKLCYLENKGWNVMIFYFSEGSVMIDEFKKFIPYRLPILKIPIQMATKKEISAFLNTVKALVHQGSDVVIESVLYGLAFWGELLAQFVGGKSVFFPLTESLPIANGRERDFMIYKYRRGEFVNSNERAKLILPEYQLDDNHQYFILPSYSNVVSEKPFPLSYNRDYPVVLSIGRINKPYFEPMLSEIIQFCDTNSITINLFIVGSTSDQGIIDRVKRTIEGCKRIIPTYFGYMYPIPLDIIRASDVAIASSGSVHVSYEQGVPTIAIDINTHEAIGVYGYTTQAKIRTTEKEVSTSELLEDILIRKLFSKTSPVCIDRVEESDKIFEQHLDVISKTSPDKQYFDVHSIYTVRHRISAKMKRVVLKLLDCLHIRNRILLIKKKYKSI